MTNTAHKLLDQLMDEEKKNLVEQQIDKLKTDILDMVVNKQEHFLQDRFVYASSPTLLHEVQQGHFFRSLREVEGQCHKVTF